MNPNKRYLQKLKFCCPFCECYKYPDSSCVCKDCSFPDSDGWYFCQKCFDLFNRHVQECSGADSDSGGSQGNDECIGGDRTGEHSGGEPRTDEEVSVGRFMQTVVREFINSLCGSPYLGFRTRRW